MSTGADAVDAVQSVWQSLATTVDVASSPPGDATAIAIPVAAAGELAPELGVDRDGLAAAGFDGEVGQALALPGTGRPMVVAFGIGDPAHLDAAKLRDAAAAFSAVVRTHSKLAAALPGTGRLAPDLAAAVMVEGLVLSRYAYDPIKAHPSGTALARLTLVASATDADAAARGARDGGTLANATQLARDLANPHPAT